MELTLFKNLTRCSCCARARLAAAFFGRAIAGLDGEAMNLYIFGSVHVSAVLGLFPIASAISGDQVTREGDVPCTAGR